MGEREFLWVRCVHGFGTVGGLARRRSWARTPVHHGRVMAIEEAANLLVAEASLGMAQPPPELVASRGDRLRPCPADELVTGHATPATDLIDKTEKISKSQSLEHGHGIQKGSRSSVLSARRSVNRYRAIEVVSTRASSITTTAARRVAL